MNDHLGRRKNGLSPPLEGLMSNLWVPIVALVKSNNTIWRVPHMLCAVSIFGSCDTLQLPIQERNMCAYAPAPRWVLRDKDGVTVQAMVEPRCGQHSNAKTYSQCLPLDFSSSNSFPCVRVIDHEGRFINLQYELTTGRIEPCQGGEADDLSLEWKDDYGAQFLSDSCDGEPFTNIYSEGGYWGFTRAREVWYAEGTLWHVSEEICVGENAKYWEWLPDTQSCELPPQLIGKPCVLRTIPDWVQELLPNYPYTMAVEYE